MVLVTKREKEIIQESFPKVRIIRTSKQHSDKHNYYCEESYDAMKLLKRLREESVVCAGDTNESK